jgi:lipopolysaccharide transport system ATP-binding protein
MAVPVISVRNLGKRYHLGMVLQHDTLRDHITQGFKSVLDAFKRPTNGNGRVDPEVLWALKGASFDVEPGEAVGIIGRNGAGKSTLLKILSQITEPTEGEVRIRGRVASLLEVGTGFHPELTGSENIFLNGAILGMSKTEIKRKFDEIVAFAEVERFIDTPVKHYSSGMYVRLAFAVAAHLDPEILIVDEVLAVGDASFQKKCLGKMGEAGNRGRTVLFVSHNLTAVRMLCKRTLLVDNGMIVADGPTETVVGKYLKKEPSGVLEKKWDQDAPGNELIKLSRMKVSAVHAISDSITMQTPVLVEIEYLNQVPDSGASFLLQLFTEEGILAFGGNSAADPQWQGRPFPRGRFRTTCQIPGNLLNCGTYSLRLMIVKNQTVIHTIDNVLNFEVADALERRRHWFGKFAGAVRPQLEWNTSQVEEDMTNGCQRHPPG